MRIAQTHGVTTLFRGLTPTIGREGLYTMAMLGVTPVIKRELAQRSGLEPNIALAVGSVAGATFAAVATHPLDTIKTCMQGDVEQKKFKVNLRAGCLGTGYQLARFSLYTLPAHAPARTKSPPNPPPPHTHTHTAYPRASSTRTPHSSAKEAWGACFEVSAGASRSSPQRFSSSTSSREYWHRRSSQRRLQRRRARKRRSEWGRTGVNGAEEEGG